jgi:calcineurin-like phosphoesterase family protein
VKPGDVIYHLGDVALGKFEDLPPIIAQLNGDIQLCLGNHDWTATKMEKAGIPGATKDRLISIGLMNIWLAHVPSDNSSDGRDLKRPYRFPDEYDLELCGHVHSSWLQKKDPNGKRIVNVGVDVWNLAPTNLLEIILVAE